MAGLTYPFPKLGEVHNYEYLFLRDHLAGQTDGAKARPVLVIAADQNRVVVLAITTKGEIDGKRTLAIPNEVSTAMGLARAAESAILVDEANAFEWVGFDVRPISGATTSCFGRSPPRFVSIVRDRFLKLGSRSIER